MIELANAKATSSAPGGAFFKRWVDHDSWSEWSPDTEWVRVAGPVQKGATGVLKPKGGPKTKFTISELIEDREYTDTSFLPGARLVFQHRAEPVGGATVLDVRVTVSGPLARVWALILGKNFRRSAKEDLDRLIRIVEAGQ